MELNFNWWFSSSKLAMNLELNTQILESVGKLAEGIGIGKSTETRMIQVSGALAT